jgi:serine protease Do
MRRLYFQGPWVLASMALLAVGAGAGLTNLQGRMTGQDQSTSAKTPRDAQAISQAKSFSHAFRYAAEQAGPSVVKIRSHTAAKKVKGVTRGKNPFGGQNPFKGTPFEDMIPDGKFFGGDQGDFGMPERDGVGSGVIIDRSGIVLTNNHVVQGADEVMVTLSDGREFKGSDIKTDPKTDLAVVRLQGAKDLPAAKLGNSDEMEIGDWVLAIGCPFDLDHTFSAGIISSKGRELSDGNHARFLQTDAAINPGNSGGPLVNIDGEVVGINTAIASNSGGYQGIGFSIPINTAKWVTSQLMDKGRVSRSYLGIQLEEITSDLAGKLGVHSNEGVLVADVMPNTPAAAAGVKEGDVVTAFAGTAVHNPHDLRDLVEKAAVGSKQTLSIDREGKRLTLDVTLKALPETLAETGRIGKGRLDQDKSGATFSSEEFGLEMADISGDEAETFKGYEGVVIRQVEDGSPAAKKGLQPGMLIRSVNKSAVKNVEQFADAMKKVAPHEAVLLLVRTANGNRYVVLQKA